MDDSAPERSALEEARTYARQLEEVNAIGRELSAMLELDPLLRRILRAAIELTHTEEGAFFLMEEADNSLVFSVVDGGPPDLVGMRIPAGTGIAGRVAATGQPLIVNDVQQNPHWSDVVDVSRDHTTRSILAVPLMKGDKCLGVLEVINRVDGQPFHRQDLTGLTALTLQAVVAMETARLHQTEIAKQRMERELQLGYALQSSLIPAGVPTIPGWEFAAWWEPAREVSGDFYDFIPLAGHLGLVLADVSDKGVHAALFMTLTRSTVRGTIHTAPHPAAGIDKANQLITQDVQNGMFVTLFYAQFRPDSNEIVYVNAGHCPPLWYRQMEHDIVPLDPTGIFLGFPAGIPHTQQTIQCAPGDLIIFYTDGITEARDTSGALFGEERLQVFLHENAQLAPAELMACLQQHLQAFVGDTPRSDDITVVIVKRE